MKRTKTLLQRISALESTCGASCAERFGGITGPMSQVLNLFEDMSVEAIVALEARLAADAATDEDSRFVDGLRAAIDKNHLDGLDARFLIEVVAEMEKSC